LRNAEHALTVLLDLTRSLTEKELPLTDALQLVSDAALALLCADDGHTSIRVIEGDDLLCGARSGDGADRRPVRFGRDEGIAGWVLREGRNCLIPDVEQDPRFVRFEGQGFAIRSMLAVPLWSAGEVLGCLAMTSPRRDEFTEDDAAVARLLANCAAPPLERARLEQLAYTDPHTRAFNRAYLEPRLLHELERSRTLDAPLSFLMMDLDHFKRVNDTYGHAAGDEVLRVFAKRVRDNVRQLDVFIRRGGEEFVLLMPGCDRERATDAAERIRQALSAEPIPLAGGDHVQRVSIGVAEWDREESPASLEARADEALYAAKRAGRDRVCIAA